MQGGPEQDGYQVPDGADAPWVDRACPEISPGRLVFTEMDEHDGG